jgi:hypothetical protein
MPGRIEGRDSREGGASLMDNPINDRRKTIVETRLTSAIRLLEQLRREIGYRDYDLAQETCETIYHQLESAKQAASRLADAEQELIR